MWDIAEEWKRKTIHRVHVWDIWVMGRRCNGLILECFEEVCGVRKYETCALGFRRSRQAFYPLSCYWGLRNYYSLTKHLSLRKNLFTLSFSSHGIAWCPLDIIHRKWRKMAEGKYSCRSTCAGEFLNPVLLWKVWCFEIGPLPRVWTSLCGSFATIENCLLLISFKTFSFEAISFILPTAWPVTLRLLIKTLNVSTFTRQ